MVGRGRSDQGRATDLGDEDITRAAVAELEGTSRQREVGRPGVARNVGVAGAVHRDASSPVAIAAAQVGGVDEGTARGVDLGDEGITIRCKTRRRSWTEAGFPPRGKLVETVSPMT